MISEKAACVFFGPMCPHGDPSVVYWDRTRLCYCESGVPNVVSTKEYQTLLGHSLEYKIQRDVHWEGHVYFSVAHRVGLNDRRDLNVSAWLGCFVVFTLRVSSARRSFTSFHQILLCHHSIYPAVPPLGQHRRPVRADSTHATKLCLCTGFGLSKKQSTCWEIRLFAFVPRGSIPHLCSLSMQHVCDVDVVRKKQNFRSCSII